MAAGIYLYAWLNVTNFAFVFIFLFIYVFVVSRAGHLEEANRLRAGYRSMPVNTPLFMPHIRLNNSN
jgi:Na+-transporting methylmalonyl-CoA/oxaloacetate decarboxylase gamma subunit